MIRDVVASDSPAIAKLLRSLGYNTTEQFLVAKLAEYDQRDDYKVMVDIEDDAVNGVIALHTISLFHNKGQIGRILALIFDESYRGNRAGKVLLEAADEYFLAQGCQHSEVAGSMTRSSVRKLLKGLGYIETEKQLLKTYKAR